ncbi:hypothetical protein ACS8Y6_06490 [Salinisphaera sp. RV14]|uniref:hypothetical protein n=1 Tax=unclassified Salinisphaera TaxID=2649847 RepID=UPI003F86DDF1
MDRARASRYLLIGLLAVAVIWGMWLVPVPQPSGGDAAGGAGDWHLAPIAPPADPKKLATRLAQRQGWGSPAGSAGGGNGAQAGSANHSGHNSAKQTATHSTILGITSVDGQPRVVLMHKDQVDTYGPGDSLPDGRRIQAIHGLEITLAPAPDNKNSKANAGAQGKSKSHNQGQSQDKNGNGAARTQTLHLFPYDKSHLGMPKTSPDHNAPNAG